MLQKCKQFVNIHIHTVYALWFHRPSHFPEFGGMEIEGINNTKKELEAYEAYPDKERKENNVLSALRSL